MSRASPMDRASGAAGVANQVPSHAREQVTVDRHGGRLGHLPVRNYQTTYPGIGPRIAVTVTNRSFGCPVGDRLTGTVPVVLYLRCSFPSAGHMWGSVV